MRLDDGGRLGELTYCTNIHAGTSWVAVRESLAACLPEIKSAVAPDTPFGVGLRLGAEAAATLSEAGPLAEFRNFLAAHDCYVFTINAFPYGPFHGEPVKEMVYAPDWSEPARLAYTDRAASVLAELVPEGRTGSVSTVPGSYKPWMGGADADRKLERICLNIGRHALHLARLEAETGRSIALALEPEPCCLLETVEETVRFFEDALFRGEHMAQLAVEAGLARRDVERSLRRHVGVCYDVCHAAVEYEDPRASVAMLAAHGIAVSKLQLSSALRLEVVDRAALARLRSFDEPVYLHQTIEDGGGDLVRYNDLPEAFAAAGEQANVTGREWRVHFHVPIFIDALEHFGTTQHFLREILALHREQPISPHLEVETYTWDVLPAVLREDGLAAAIARELNWVKAELGVG